MEQIDLIAERVNDALPEGIRIVPDGQGWAVGVHNTMARRWFVAKQRPTLHSCLGALDLALAEINPDTDLEPELQRIMDWAYELAPVLEVEPIELAA